jgi:uncharacterized protein (DUF2267 family)
MRVSAEIQDIYSFFNFLLRKFLTRVCIRTVIRTPVTIPTVNESVIMNLGVTEKKNDTTSIKHISTAMNATIIIRALFFMK